MSDCMTQSNRMHEQGLRVCNAWKKLTSFFHPCIQLGANSLSFVSSAGGSDQQKLPNKEQGTRKNVPAGSNMAHASGVPKPCYPAHLSVKKDSKLGSLQMPFKAPSCH